MFRISSLPPRDQLFQPRDLVTSPPPGSPGTESSQPSPEARAAKAARPASAATVPSEAGPVVVDLSPARSREAAAAAVAAANAQAAVPRNGDIKAIAGMLREAVRQNPGQLMAAQGAPDAARVMNLLFGN